MKAYIQDLVNQNNDYVVECYRHLHANPELSFEEYKTAEFIQNELKFYYHNHAKFLGK